MAIGSILDVINATQVRLFLNPDGANDEFVVLQEITMPLTRPETRESVDGGAVYFYGQHDNEFTALILLTGNDIASFLDFNLLTNNTLAKNTYGIQLVSKSGSNKTIRVVATTPAQEIEKLGSGGVKIKQTFRITADVSGANVT